MKILHLIDTLNYSGSARQVQLLGPASTRGGVAVEICSLGSADTWTTMLREAGVTVHALQWTRWFDPRVLWHLRRLLGRIEPDVIHVWRLPALRALAAVAPSLLSRVVMSAPLPAAGPLAWWDRWLLQHVRVLAVAGVSDQRHCLNHGLVTPTLRVVAPAVASPEPLPAPAAKNRRSIVCMGKLEHARGFRLAIWAFDILCHVHDDLQLVLVGSGSQLAPLRELTRRLDNDHVHFLGERPDVSELLSEAEVVWVPSTANCGRQVALEAMAHGRAVIGADVPCLRDVIVDGETGWLVPVGDVAAIARRTHELLRNPALRQRLGHAARRHVAQRFSLAEAVQRWHEVYAAA